MHGTGGLEIVVYVPFERLQRYVQIVRKVMIKCYNYFIIQYNDFKSTS